MKDNKYIPLFLITSCIIIGMFFIMGYFFNKTNNAEPNSGTSVKNPIAKISNPNNALLQEYKSAISDMDNVMDSALQDNNPNLDKKLVEYYRLRKEIGNLLSEDADIADLNNAKQKIELLQEKINDLRNRNILVEADNLRLNAIIRRLSQPQIITTANTNPDNRITRPASREKQNEGGLFIASDLKINNNRNGTDADSDTNNEDEKILGSFYVKNNKTYPNAELYIVVQQPNGQILRSSDWESGMFNTKEGQRKMYSLLIKFDYNKDELRKCNFSINTEEYQKGRYNLQVYHKGVLIANITKTLS